ncbi:MAG: uncharacterized protein KVP18_000272 [Porospora cf. gigantea A]|uniref:uncharacterized protein n=1 Tax=Porospora cf. gigantea A TaxID=2853593 RepID=UPI0035594D78|nr:MAG: hypothetical protein KVP18_000272 [Porospora cf. gigantea A]
MHPLPPGDSPGDSLGCGSTDRWTQHPPANVECCGVAFQPTILKAQHAGVQAATAPVRSPVQAVCHTLYGGFDICGRRTKDTTSAIEMGILPTGSKTLKKKLSHAPLTGFGVPMQRQNDLLATQTRHTLQPARHTSLELFQALEEAVGVFPMPKKSTRGEFGGYRALETGATLLKEPTKSFPRDFPPNYGTRWRAASLHRVINAKQPYDQSMGSTAPFLLARIAHNKEWKHYAQEKKRQAHYDARSRCISDLHSYPLAPECLEPDLRQGFPGAMKLDPAWTKEARQRAL